MIILYRFITLDFINIKSWKKEKNINAGRPGVALIWPSRQHNFGLYILGLGLPDYKTFSYKETSKDG
jgi:hypothetical protein